MKNEYKTYHTLTVHEKADELALLAYKITAKFPREELYGITNQIRRAAVSVPANIAEGYSRRTEKEKIRFLNMAQGSVVELRYFVEFSEKLDYLDKETAKSVDELAVEVIRLLCGFMKKLNQSLVTNN